MRILPPLDWESATAAPARHRGIHIGISGWRYTPWRGVFYPKDLVQRRELEFASRRFDTIEINGSFYSLQLPQSYRRWYEDTSPGFIFAVKAPRFITHLRRLREIETPLANFFASGILELREKLGPILWQFPPNLRYDATQWSDFLTRLPRDTHVALEMARAHDDRVRHVSLPENRKMRVRHAVEIRNKSFCNDEFVALLRRHGVALVVADTAGKWPYVEDVTADFIYMRLHGDKEIYASGYTPRALDRWASRILDWSGGGEPADAPRISDRPPRRRASRDVYCYFDNDIKVKAPFDAVSLRDKIVAGMQARRIEDGKRAAG
jgi:uncharacterized protein YecE (DUF72 family)